MPEVILSGLHLPGGSAHPPTGADSCAMLRDPLPMLNPLLTRTENNNIVHSPDAFRRALARLPAPVPVAPRAVFMVMPEAFHLDGESAVDNHYMHLECKPDPDRALAEARALVRLIESVGVPVTCFPGRADQPDGIFPNNVFGTVPGRFIVGRMFHHGRQAEAGRRDIRAHFADRVLIDLSGRDLVAELTGAMVIDRGRKMGFCGMSTRVDDAGMRAMHDAFDLALTYRFDLSPDEYHTNVVLSVLAGRACILPPPSAVDPRVSDAIADAYPARTLFLDDDEKNAFAGNCIALTETDLFMSQTGADALRPSSRAALSDWGFTLHTAEMDEIEKAGGSLRCMLAEIF